MEHVDEAALGPPVVVAVAAVVVREWPAVGEHAVALAAAIAPVGVLGPLSPVVNVRVSRGACS